MSLSTPTVEEVSDNILAQLESNLSETFPLLPKAFARVLARVLGAVFILLYKYAGFIFLQQFVSTASWRETEVLGRKVRPLVEWGRLIGVGDPTPATRAEHVVEITVESQVGSLPAGSQLLFPATGVIYLTTSAVALDAATKQVTIRASSDQQGGDGSGTIGNLDTGEVVSFASPLANVARDAVVISQVAAGADAEAEETYRGRVVSRFQRPPQGGAYADYREWGEELGGILRIFPYTGDPGEVDVYVLATVASSGSADGVPTSAQLDAVKAALEQTTDGLAARRPVNAALNVYGISRLAFDVEITGLAAADTATAQDKIEAGLDEYLRSREPFIVGLSVLPRKDRVTEAALGGVAEGITNALGATFTTLTVEISGLPNTAYTLDDGELAKLGTASFS